MALAQKLNELAAANSQGLLNDNEYRLLRENLFKQDMTGRVIPVELPIVPVASPPTSSPRKQVNIPPSPQTSSARSKASIAAAGFTNLFRRATGRKPPTFTYELPPPTNNTHKRGLISRILPRKHSPLRPDRNKRIVDSAVRSPRTSSPSLANLRSPPQTPTGAAVRSTIDVSSAASGVFDDEDLHTTKDFRAAILATQVEATRIWEAFNQLESTTSHRIHLQTVRRFPSAIPPLYPDRKSHGRVGLVHDLSDGVSVDSRSSITTSLSRSKSVSSFRSKPHSPRFFPPVHPTHSVYSIASQGRVGVNSSITATMSRSMLVDDEEVHGMEEEVSSHAEVLEVQQRRQEVMARYEARLEYLRAKLKAAELQEKLSRK